MAVMTERVKVLFFCMGWLSLCLFTGCSETEEGGVWDAYTLNSQQAFENVYKIMYSFEGENFTGLKVEDMTERFKIVHISDVHISDWAEVNRPENPKNLLEVVRFSNLPELKINALIASGDFIGQVESTKKETAQGYMDSFVSAFYGENYVPSFVCTGNHDANMLSKNEDYYLSKKDIHQHLFDRKNYERRQPVGENYYYSDLPDPLGGTIRIIALDNVDQDAFEYRSQNYSCITQKQVDWLVNVALKEGMTDDHAVIILNHHPLQPYSNNQKTYMCAGVHLYGERLVPDIVNAFLKKTTLDRSYKTAIAPVRTIHVNADFSGSSGDFICYLGGHAHTFGVFDVQCNDSSPVKQIMLLGNTLSPECQNNKYYYTERNSKLKSNSFAIYAIDRNEKNIYRTFFGAYPTDGPIIEAIPYR